MRVQTFAATLTLKTVTLFDPTAFLMIMYFLTKSRVADKKQNKNKKIGREKTDHRALKPSHPTNGQKNSNMSFSHSLQNTIMPHF